MRRALDDDYAPRAAARILDKDIGIAVDFALRHGVACPVGTAARHAFTATVAAGLGEEDDAAICKYYRRRAGLADPF
jgi:3-hydroxyisobutyrate dehydrogenase-like beta-hydroxyacid dehydrogenase